jgi:hypothetical protein
MVEKCCHDENEDGHELRFPNKELIIELTALVSQIRSGGSTESSSYRATTPTSASARQ